MSFVFRTDSGLAIGTGHVMRCLTLARELTRRGQACRFICRDLPGSLNAQVAGEFALTVLPAPEGPPPVAPPFHAAWAGVDWSRDAAETRAVLGRADWLVLDHYALDARWQRAALPPDTRLLVLDELADRAHDCDLLLDQTPGRSRGDYDGLIPPRAICLTGPDYALLRREFATSRPAALLARQNRGYGLSHLLIAPGGVDADDATGTVLKLLSLAKLPRLLQVTVVLGPTAPHLDRLRALRLPFECQIIAASRDMAGLMTQADLCLGAAGVSMLERCCLGLPSLLMILADNQRLATDRFTERGAALSLGEPATPGLGARLTAALTRLSDPASLSDMSRSAAALCDGRGTARVADALLTAATG